MLVHEPDGLPLVADDVRGELRRDHEIDRPSVDLVQVEQPPLERVLEHTRARVPLERHGDEIRLVPALVQLERESLREDLGAAPRERHLRRGDDDSHGRVRATIA